MMESKAMSMIEIEMRVSLLLVVVIGSQVSVHNATWSYRMDKQMVWYITEDTKHPCDTYLANVVMHNPKYSEGENLP
jgi:hypothetical protein